jgi:hypothetical protein
MAGSQRLRICNFRFELKSRYDSPLLINLLLLLLPVI